MTYIMPFWVFIMFFEASTMQNIVLSLLVSYMNDFICNIGLFFSILITGVITDAIKDAVGRPRPDFFWRCFPNGIGVGVLVTCCLALLLISQLGASFSLVYACTCLI